MLFLDADGLFEFLRGTLPYYTIVFVPILIVISPMTPVLGAHEFTVYRMQQFDLQGTAHGCRSSLISMEARTIHTTPYTRKCVVAKLSELTHGHFQDIVQQGAGGLLVLLPTDYSSLSPEEQQHIAELEKSLLEEEVNIPVYFAPETPDIREIYDGMQNSPTSETKTAAEELLASITNSGYQLVVSGSQPKSLTDVQIVSIQGKLSGFGVEEQLPTVAIVAHYDAYGAAPALTYGADSNGSGVAALLEIARLLSRLYTSSRTHPRFNVVFLLSGGGKFNFQGTKKWIEDNIDSSEGSLLPDALYTLCLDSIGADNTMYVHVSKPPKDGSPGAIFLKELQAVSNWLYPELNITMIHKKINLAEEVLAWEHERFSIRRLPAFTLSHLVSPKALSKNSIIDTREKVDIKILARNVKVVAETLARHMYNLSSDDIKAEIFTDGSVVQEEYLSAWMDHLTSQSRSAQLLALGNPRHPIISTLEQALSRYLKEVKLSIFKPDKREPEVVFYEPFAAMMNAYRVKPAVFDLFLAVAIAAYLSIVYLVIINFYRVENFLSQTAVSSKAKQA